MFSLGSHLSPLVFVYFRVRAETKANVTSRRGWVDRAFTSLLRWSSILESKDGAEHQPPATGLSGFLGVSRDLSGFLGVSQAFSGFLPKPPLPAGPSTAPDAAGPSLPSQRRQKPQPGVTGVRDRQVRGRLKAARWWALQPTAPLCPSLPTLWELTPFSQKSVGNEQFFQ